MVAASCFLTDEEYTSIQETLNIIGSEAASNSYCTPFNVLRWIRAYKSTVEGAKNLKRHLRVRKIKNLDKLLESSDEYDKTISKHFPIHIIGRNKRDDNKVLVCEPSGRIDVYHLLNLQQMTPFMTNRFRVMEKILKKINELEAETKQISGGILLIDLIDIELQPSLINILKGPYRIMWGTLFDQYPEIFSQILIINAPVFMNILWNACSSFIDNEIRVNTITNYSISCKHRIKASSLPSGSSLIQIYKFEEGVDVEFFVNHHDDCTMWNKDDLEEVYAACERPGLRTTDYWQWKTPLNGYYYVCFGNEKAWFLSISIDFLVSIRHPNGSTTPTAPIAKI
uniref:CRAL-TRIO domain-containing protein n=1 Tax=Syphacia muris TaxID=451379 RepID=A0A0N5AJJ1_9BILA